MHEREGGQLGTGMKKRSLVKKARKVGLVKMERIESAYSNIHSTFKYRP